MKNPLRWFGITTNQDLQNIRREAYRRGVFRGYNAAAVNRFTSDWTTNSVTPDYEGKNELSIIRARARDAVKNDPTARKIVRAWCLNVPGPRGFKLDMDVRNPDGSKDELANIKVKELVADWSKPENCTVTGTMSFRDVQLLVMKNAIVPGENLIRKVRLGKYGFQLQIFEPDLLDETYTLDLPNGNFIRLGVEFDAFRKPVAYWLKSGGKVNQVYSTYSGNRIRIPAAEIYHFFDFDSPFQSRGISWLAPVLYKIRHLNGWEDAGLINARSSANKRGYFRNPTNSQAAPGQDQLPADAKDENGNLILDSEPGESRYIGDLEYQSVDPTYPEAQHEMYMRTTSRRITSGVDLSYATGTGDLAGTSYGSGRIGMLEQQASYAERQEWMIDNFMNPVFTDLLEMALLSGQLRLPFNMEKFNKPVWYGPPKTWLDPESDTKSKFLQVMGGIETLTNLAAEKGEDIEDIFETLKREKELADQYGLTLGVTAVNINDKFTTANNSKEPAQASAFAEAIKRFLLEPSNGNGAHK